MPNYGNWYILLIYVIFENEYAKYISINYHFRCWVIEAGAGVTKPSCPSDDVIVTGLWATVAYRLEATATNLIN